MRRSLLAVLSTFSLALLLLLLPSASASALTTAGATSAVRMAPRPTAAQLPSSAKGLSRASGLHRLALVGCYTTSVRGVSGGQKGTWYYTICYDTVQCAWVIVRALFSPDPCKPGKPC